MSIRKYAKVALVSGATLVGGAIAYCIWKALEPEERTVAKDVHVEVATAIDKTPAELFAFWRDFRNLALFMSQPDFRH